ncbi:TIGR02300 family protein [Aestuariivirga sp.]|uniref:TIGR02300 family protein n=1 Tax=Aestuariivirga sp. TaxID=2650926 RepID=UPI0025C2EB9D|nr:TIGR02300 family protein [Aestuariivirga sp.]MCA3555401.1 TIGR02300 family protein [Aestuariivirga sp.]
MVKAELGTKRTCPSCAARFYDLMKNPIVCPKCNANFVAAQVLPSKGDMPAMAPAPKPRAVEVADDAEVADVELISLEDAEAPDTGDDETAGIEDVDLGEEGAAETEDDTFLVEEEEDGDNMSGLLDTGGKEDEEEV